MVEVLKYITLLLSGALGVFLTFYKEKAYRRTEKRVRQRKVRAWLMGVALLSMALGVLFVWLDDRASEKYKSWQRQQIETLNDQVAFAVTQVTNAQMSLWVANDILTAQQRSIGSLVYNIETSFEGKRRFANCFDALALLDEENDYKPLICDDGVVVFMFAKKDDQLTAFHFYANSEINEVLSGMPIGTELKIENGKFVIARGSELALALERAQERRTPRYGKDAASHRLAIKALAEQMRLFFRYVYRAENFMCYDAYREVARGQRPWDGWCISFNYTVSPAKNDTCRRSVEFWMEESEIVGYCGLTMREFSEKILAYCRAHDVEPKVRISDIDSLEKRGLRFEERQTFPYSKEKVERSFP